MTLRLGVSVGGTTSSASMSDQIKRYRLRDLPPPSSAQDALNLKMNGGNSTTNHPTNLAHESLKDKCIRVVVENFAQRPVDEGSCSPEQMRAITSQLPVDLDPKVGALHVFDEGYWKRCCLARLGWSKCDLMAHGQIWKQLYFETLAQEQLETLPDEDLEGDFQIAGIKGPPIKASEAKSKVLACLEACQDYIFSLTIRELNAHPSMDRILLLLPNLSKLDLTYGVRKCNMNTVRSAFGMTASDATSISRALSNAVKYCPNLTSLTLKGNRIDDDLLRILMEGLLGNDTVTALDVSHNRITSLGARMISKLLGSESVLTALDLSDNQIREEGGRYIGRGLKKNDSLLELNLRLNLLKDAGARMLVDGIRANTAGSTLTRLNLAGNSVGSETVESIAALLSAGASGTLGEGVTAPLLTSIDLSCNELVTGDIESLEESLAENNTLTSLDTRGNSAVGPEAEPAIESIARLLKNNELAAR